MSQSLPDIKAKRILNKSMAVFVLLIVATSVIACLPVATGQSSSNSYNYKFTVNEEGFTQIEITFQSVATVGSSWVIMPKFSPWKYDVISPGEITGSNLINETQDYVGQDYYFYQVFEFSFSSSSSFQMKIQFNMTEGALIIERTDAHDGMFLSPLIGFNPKSVGKAEVIFPSYFTVQKIAPPSGRIVSNRVIFDPIDPHVRLQIQFETGGTPKLKQIKQGVFNFQAVERYENYAYEILNLYNNTYDELADLFNVTLGNIDVQFFIPEFDTLLSVGGYVPFIKQRMGKININIFFVRAVNGTIEVIALHELIHHFLWKAELSPDLFLWFHEGAAQFVSIETVDGLGYEGAAMERDRLEQEVSQLIPQTAEKNLGFLQQWTPERQPRDSTELYVASYYVISRLAKKYGGLDFYKRFFKQIRGLKVETDDELAFHLSMAANASVDLTLKQWGFDIQLLYTINQSNFSPELIYEAEKTIDGVSPVFQPYKSIAKSLYRQALLRLERGDYEEAAQLLNAAILLANLAPLLTLLTIVAVFAIIIYILHKRTAEPSFELPPPPTFEEASA